MSAVNLLKLGIVGAFAFGVANTNFMETGELSLSNAEAAKKTCVGYTLNSLKKKKYKGKTGFVAIAVNEKGLGCGYAYGGSNKKATEENAVNQCKKYSEKYRAKQIECVLVDG